MAIPYGPTEKQGLSEKELLKVIALGQANVIRAIGMAEENAEGRSGDRGNYWNGGHFDELASSIEKAVDAVAHAEDSANDKRISDLKTAADSLPKIPENPPAPRRISDWIYAGLYLAACFWLLYKAWDIGIIL